MRTLPFAILIFVSSSCWSLSEAREKSICYDEIGCFNNAAPFDDMPLPMSPNEIAPTWHLYQSGKGSRIISSANELNVDDLLVLTHGLAGNYQNTLEWHQPIVDGLFEARPTADILFVEWEKGAAFGFGLKLYSQPASNTRVIGPLIAKFLESNARFDSTKVHCLGFSLGSHVCGFAGKALKNKWGRISAMDPALPDFDKDDARARVDKSDAAFVDVVHTSWVGLQRPVGHVDFWVNGAKRQPGCVSRRRRSTDDVLLSGRMLPFDYMRGRTVSMDEASPEIINQKIRMETEDSEENDLPIPKQGKGFGDSIIDHITDFFGCSHYRAPLVYAASINTKPNCDFLFCPCASKKDFDDGKCATCNLSVGQQMGYNSIDLPNRGEFWGSTLKTPPFCLNGKK